jgi:hypothetical protein
MLPTLFRWIIVVQLYYNDFLKSFGAIVVKNIHEFFQIGLLFNLSVFCGLKGGIYVAYLNIEKPHEQSKKFLLGYFWFI